MRLAVAVEGDDNLRINGVAPGVPEICSGIEGEPINAELRILRERSVTSIGIRCARANGGPCVPVPPIQTDRNAASRLAKNRV